MAIPLSPSEKLLRAKLKLTNHVSPFISNLVINFNHIISDVVPVAGVSDNNIYYNEEAINEFSIGELMAVISHEMLHVILRHEERRGDRNPKAWNIACDMVVNSMLKRSYFMLPDSAIFPPRYSEAYSEEELYKEIANDPLYNQADYFLDILQSEDPIKTLSIKGAIKDINSKLKANGSSVLDNFISAKGSPSIVNSNYREEIKKIFNNVSRLDIHRPRRKLIPNFIFPRRKEVPSKLHIAIDTSGSIEKETLDKFINYIKYTLSINKAISAEMIICDCEIQEIVPINSATNLSNYDFKGRGGTNFNPVIEYCNNQNSKGLVYFTDLEGPNIVKPNYPLLWVVYGSKNIKINLGKIVYIDK